jgi:hypothetical protein
MARTLRQRIPGYRTLSRRLVPTMSRSAAGRRMLSLARVGLGRGSEGGVLPSIGITAGAHLGTAESERLPILAVLALECPDDTLAEALDRLATAQVLTGGFRVLVVSDRPVFGVTRRHGYPLELLPDRAGLATVEPDADWDDTVLRRVQGIVRDYGVRAVVPVQGLTAAPWTAVLALAAVAP